MHREIAAIAKNDGVGVLAVPVVTYGALAVLLLAGLRLAINCCSRARPRAMGLWRFRIRLRYLFLQGVPFFLDFGDCNFKDFACDRFQFVNFALCIQGLQPHVVLLVHVVLNATQVGSAVGDDNLALGFLPEQLVHIFVDMCVASLQELTFGTYEVVTLLISDVHHGLFDVFCLSKGLALEK